MKAYTGSAGITPLILNLGTRQRWLLYRGVRAPIPIEEEAEWAPESCWTTDHPAHYDYVNMAP
jgi:hypothetical protein